MVGAAAADRVLDVKLAVARIALEARHRPRQMIRKLLVLPVRRVLWVGVAVCCSHVRLLEGLILSDLLAMECLSRHVRVPILPHGLIGVGHLQVAAAATASGWNDFAKTALHRGVSHATRKTSPIASAPPFPSGCQ